MRTWTGLALMVIVDVLLESCGVLPRLDPVPPAQTEQAQITGIADARYWLDRDLSPFIRSVIRDTQREQDALAQAGRPTDPMPPINFLAISGGSDAGAFAAGILSGWTAHGDRPKFKVVTGISAGALIAPFAFLGPRYDEVIRKVATAIGPDDVFHHRNPLVGLARDGMADSEPLARIVAKYVTPEILAAIAHEFANGRVLEIGTTDLDAGRPVTWNMGAIASSQAPGALDLFRKIMIASTSIPGAVSPVMIDVVAGGKHFQEMHVDGGVITQMFTYPSSTVMELVRATGKPLNRDLRLFVIRNGKLEPEWSATKRRTLSIGGRAINALVQRQGINDLYRIYNTAKIDNADFNLAYIGSDFAYPRAQAFDTAYMNHLYTYAYSLSATGHAWHKALPNEAPATD